MLRLHKLGFLFYSMIAIPKRRTFNNTAIDGSISTRLVIIVLERTVFLYLTIKSKKALAG